MRSERQASRNRDYPLVGRGAAKFTRFIFLLVVCAAGLPSLASGQAITEFRIPSANAQPFGITTGPDGNLWFTDHGPTSQIGRLTTGGVFTLFPVTTPTSSPREITLGPDGNLWFTEEDGNNIGRITPSGVVTEFPVPTASSLPAGITAGPDGNLWFTEKATDKIGKCTTAGVITEFSLPSSASGPRQIVTGADGNLWFTEREGNRIGQITTAGVITEFTVPTASALPRGITSGPDGNLWFTEEGGNKIGQVSILGVFMEFAIPTANTAPFGIATGSDGNLWFTQETGNNIGRITVLGLINEFPIPSQGQFHRGITPGPDGNIWWCERGNHQIARVTPGPLAPVALSVDPAGNGVFEAGETVSVVPTWKNNDVAPHAVTGVASNFTGPAGPTYTISDSSADYGTLAAGGSNDCQTATGNCYSLGITAAVRPAAHWDATFDENLGGGTLKGWTLHIGGSFTDVPTSHQFYRFVENIFHNGITGGCGTGIYCPESSVTRAQMAVFLLKGEHGQDYLPPSCTGVFADVPCPSQFANWIERLAAEGITAGCGSGNYCPNDPVTRAQMAVFLLKAEHGSGYVPPACTGIFTDVPCPSLFADWIEQLFAEGITGGCGTGIYCPNSPNTRGQMAVFLTKTFGLLLYGP